MCIFEEGKFEDWKYITEDWFKKGEGEFEYTQSDKKRLVDVNTLEPNGNDDNIIVEWYFNQDSNLITNLEENINKAYNSNFGKNSKIQA